MIEISLRLQLLLIVSVTLNLLSASVLLQIQANLADALAPVIKLNAAINVLTDEVAALTNKVALLQLAGSGVASVVERVASSKTATYLRDQASRLGEKAAKVVSSRMHEDQ